MSIKKIEILTENIIKNLEYPIGSAFDLETAENNVGLQVDELNVTLVIQSEKSPDSEMSSQNSNLSDEEYEDQNIDIDILKSNPLLSDEFVIDLTKKNSKIIRTNNKPTKCTH